MKTRKSYSYSILRYVHDTSTSEFINVGVAVHSPAEEFFQVKCRSTLGRISEMFPDVNGVAFRSLMKHVSKRFEGLSESFSSSLCLEGESQTLEELLKEVMPKDDSALIWSPVSSGLSTDAQQTLNHLFMRYVTKYDHAQVPHKRTDEDVWREFKRELENRHISRFFSEKVIEGNDDEVKFKSAWKNGKWHCVEPISLDLSAADTIREKAHRFLGQITSVAKSANDSFKVYLVIGEPANKNLTPALEKAVKILKNLPVENEIYMENQRDLLLDNLSRQIKIHESAL